MELNINYKEITSEGNNLLLIIQIMLFWVRKLLVSLSTMHTNSMPIITIIMATITKDQDSKELFD